jgi:predicted RNA-binding protein with PUA-like domain
MNYWLMKSEPNCYSVHDLKRDGTTMWDGVRNYQVRNMMRDQMRIGDKAIFYHSNASKDTGCAGVMTIASKSYPDPTQFDPRSDHPDPKSDPENPRWLVVDVAYEQTFRELVKLSEIKHDPAFSSMPLVKRGNRLSVFPINKVHFDRLCMLGFQ